MNARPICSKTPCVPQRIYGRVHRTRVIDGDSDTSVVYCAGCGRVMDEAEVTKHPKVVSAEAQPVPTAKADPLAVMEALATFDTSRWWSIKKRGCSLTLENPERRRSWGVKTQVRRKKGEALADMVVRCATLARQRLASGWTPPAPKKTHVPEPAIARALRQAKTLPFKRKES